MTRLSSRNCSLLAIVTLFAAASVALALPPIPKYIPQVLEGKDDYKAFLADFKAGDTKCASCHIPKADKKAKGHALNDFGQAMHKHLDDKAFMAADKAKDDATALKLFNEAWGKAIVDKNEAGQTYAELLKAGKLPGKNPEPK